MMMIVHCSYCLLSVRHADRLNTRGLMFHPWLESVRDESAGEFQSEECGRMIRYSCTACARYFYLFSLLSGYQSDCDASR